METSEKKEELIRELRLLNFTKKNKIKDIFCKYKYMGSGKFKVTVQFIKKYDKTKEIHSVFFFTQDLHLLMEIDKLEKPLRPALYYQYFRFEIDRVVINRLLTI